MLSVSLVLARLYDLLRLNLPFRSFFEEILTGMIILSSGQLISEQEDEELISFAVSLSSSLANVTFFSAFCCAKVNVVGVVKLVSASIAIDGVGEGEGGSCCMDNVD